MKKAQELLQDLKLDGWLLYDFHGSNPLARKVLDVKGMTTRRFFYWIPKEGECVKIVHAIEQGALDHMPGRKEVYLSWQSLEKAVQNALKGAKTVAMEYSPRNSVPYIAKVDAGTVELVRSFGVNVVSSGDFLPHFTAVLTKAQMQAQERAATLCNDVISSMWRFIQKHPRITELDVQAEIMREFAEHKLVTDHAPIIAFGVHSADPHYESTATPLKKGDLVLIDLWAKFEDGVYGDLTKVAVNDARPTAKQQTIFQIVKEAQLAAINLVKNHKGRLEGWQVDDAARSVITKAGYGDFFIHRTGHNIETELHGSGAHIDNLEMHDTRPLLPNTCFSIEPGIYLPNEFGIRLENDVLYLDDFSVLVTGTLQSEIVCLS